MVKITKDNNETTFEIKGIHKILSFKSQLRIPNSHIITAYQDEEQIMNWKGIRGLGTHIPFLISAGTFYQFHSSSCVFMDIVDNSKAIIVELHDEEFKKLFIEVENPTEAINVLTNAWHF